MSLASRRYGELAEYVLKKAYTPEEGYDYLRRMMSQLEEHHAKVGRRTHPGLGSEEYKIIKLPSHEREITKWGSQTQVTDGKWMFEVTITSSPLDIQIGWCSQEGSSYLSRDAIEWTLGDVIGSYLDLEMGTITTHRNGQHYNTTQGVITNGAGYHPTVRVRSGKQRCMMNIGARPFLYPEKDYHALCSDREFYGMAGEFLTGCMERLVKHLPAGCPGAYEAVLLLSTQIFEFLIPLMPSQHAMEPWSRLLASLAPDRLQEYLQMWSLCSPDRDEFYSVVDTLFKSLAYQASAVSCMSSGVKPTSLILLAVQLMQFPRIAMNLPTQGRLIEYLDCLVSVAFPHDAELHESSMREEYLQSHELAVDALLRLLLTVPEGQPLHGVWRSWLLLTINRSREDPTHPSLCAIVTALVRFLSNLPLKHSTSVPFWLTTCNMPVPLPRVGGTLDHLLAHHLLPDTIRQDDSQSQSDELFNICVLLLEGGALECVMKKGLPWRRRWNRAHWWSLLTRLTLTIDSVHDLGAEARRYLPEFYYRLHRSLLVLQTGETTKEPNFPFNLSSQHRTVFDQGVNLLASCVSAAHIQSIDIKARALRLLIVFSASEPFLNYFDKLPCVSSLVENLVVLVGSTQESSLGFYACELLVGLWNGARFGRESVPLFSRVHRRLSEMGVQEHKRMDLLFKHVMDGFFTSGLDRLRSCLRNERHREWALYYTKTRIYLEAMEMVAVSCPSAVRQSPASLQRVVAVVTLVLDTVFQAPFRDSWSRLVEIQRQRQCAISMLLAPVSGILVQLHDPFRGGEIPVRFDHHQLAVLENLISFPWDGVMSQVGLQRDLPRLRTALEVAAVITGQDLSEEDSENQCDICCCSLRDTRFLPCHHSSCLSCISRQIQQKGICFYCRSPILEIISITQA